MTDGQEVVIEKIELEKKQYRVTSSLGEHLFSEETVIKYGLFKGRIFTRAQFDEILGAESYQSLLNKAIKFLSHQERSVKEVEEYLQKQEADEQTASRIIEKLIAFGYLNDVRYASLVREYALMTRKGPRYLENRLREKGVAMEIIAAALDDYGADREEELAASVTADFLRKSAGEPKVKLKVKLYQKLIRDGFSPEIAARQAENADYPPVSRDQLRADIARLRAGIPAEADEKTRQKIIRKLAERGYSYHEIMTALAEDE